MLHFYQQEIIRNKNSLINKQIISIRIILFPSHSNCRFIQIKNQFIYIKIRQKDMEMRLQGSNMEIQAKRSNTKNRTNSNRSVNNSNSTINRNRNQKIYTIQSQQVSNLQTIKTDYQQFISLPNNYNNLNDNPTSVFPNRPLTSNKHNPSSSLSTVQHLIQLRKSNLINILSTKQPQQRTQKQINIIIESLKYQPFFSSIQGNVKLLEEISLQMNYVKYKQGEVVSFNDDDHDRNNNISIMKSNRCYVIIKGSVDLLSQQKEMRLNQQQYQQQKVQQQTDRCEQKLRNITVTNQTFWSPTQCLITQSKQSNNYQSKRQQQSQKVNSPIKIKCQFDQQQVQICQFKYNNNKNENIPQQQKLKLIKSFNQGQCLGYYIQPINNIIDQINNNNTSLLFLRPTSTTHFISISKQHYETIILANKANEIKKLTDFLSNLQLFKLVYRYSIENFINCMEQVHYQYKGYLYKEGDSIDHVYIVKNGQFSLSKVINPNNNNINHTINQTHDNPTTNKQSIPSIDPDSQIQSLKRQQNNYRQAQIKNITIGEIIGDAQSYLKIQTYTESCKCISQSATVYKIDKHQFLEKLLSSQNQLPLIKNYLNNKYKNKLKQIQSFINKHLNNQTIRRMWPVSKSCDRKLKASKSSIAQRPSTANKKMTQSSLDFFAPNFFDQFNRTIPKNKQRKRINYKLTINLNLNKQRNIDSYSQKKKRSKTSMDYSDLNLRNIKTSQSNRQRQKTIRNQIVNSQKCLKKQQIVEQQKMQEVPSCIKDIVGMVNCKQQYFKTRNKKTQIQTKASFQFQTHKIPIFIQQKYKHLLMRLKAK